MPLKITSDSALLTAGQAVTLQAAEDQGNIANVSWAVTPPLGSLFPSPSSADQKSSTATYVAPAIVQSEQTVAITATSESGAVSITISLTPTAISIVPPTVELHGGQKQRFTAVVASGNAQDVTWVVAPDVGKLDLDPDNTLSAIYTADALIPTDGILTVTAVCKNLGKQASSRITLTPEPWRGLGPALLAGYLFIVFLSVYLLIALWPSDVANIDQLKTAQAQAQVDLDRSEQALKSADSEAAALTGPLKQDVDRAEAALKDATDKLNDATSPTVKTTMVSHINREIDLLCLVLLAGAIGSFLHMAQSFSDFAGNRTLKSSWLWWYFFLPFVGSGLALALYTGLRGGLITVAAASAIKSSDLNPYGLVAGGILAGLFSKQATSKLGEIFDTVFQSSSDSKTKDQLNSGSKGGSAPGATGSSSASGTSLDV